MTPKRILIFNVNWVGDVLFSTATIRNIRYNFPDSHIACVIPERCYAILEGNPHLNEIIFFDEKSRHRGIFGKIRFVMKLRREKFDIVFLLHRSFTRAFICWCARIPERIGYYSRKRGFLLTKGIVSPFRDEMHRIDYYLNIVAKSGFKVQDRFTDFYLSEKDKRFVEDFLKNQAINQTDFVIGINPGGNWMQKRWPKEYFAVLADNLAIEFQAQIIITGGPQDVKLARHIQRLMRRKVIIVCGQFGLKQLGALAKRLDIFITADTGPLHIANSVGAKKIIALFGPTHPAITGPCPSNNVHVLAANVNCKIPCYEENCSNNRCMRSITPDEVLKLVRKIAV
ncbi:MAG: lipopolysaccharide heptosyltransferase II [Candidatus Omnitrophota bacterium]|jgi:lipopolysaccharide heptosyltransferase II|nr:MAG: lipopolysaccharide heptosyltransferase II [Candidatus Omnitrophota bacterium]